MKHIFTGIVLIFVLFELTFGDIFKDSTFSNGIKITQMARVGDSLMLIPYDTLLMPILVEENYSTGSDESFSPEVIYDSLGTFTFFWGEHQGDYNTVFRRSLHIFPDRFYFKNPSIVMSNLQGKTRIGFLNSSRGATPGIYLSAFRKGGQLFVAKSKRSYPLNCKPNNEIFHVENDTFYLIHKQDNSYIKGRKFRTDFSGVTPIDTGDGVIISTNHDIPAGNFTNLSAAIDSVGNILMVCTRGADASTKILEYRVMDRSFTVSDSGVIDREISFDVNGIVPFKDAPLVSYAPNKFAAVYWKFDGVYLYLVDIFTGTGKIGASRIEKIANASNDLRIPTLTSSKKEVIVAWKNLGKGIIEGKRIPITNGTLGKVPVQNVTFVNTGHHVDDKTPELNIAIDNAGNMAFTWTADSSRSVTSVWANMGIMYRSGTFVSDLVNMKTSPGDSLYFTPTVHDTSLMGGMAEVYIQTGLGTDTSTWKPWVRTDDSIGLNLNTKGEFDHFRYKTILYRNPVDSYNTPVMNEIMCQWNVKPQMRSLDSVFVNNIKIESTLANDTIDIVSGRDEVSVYYTLYDNDTTDQLTIKTDWPNGSGSVISNPIGKVFTSTVMFPPVVAEDSIVHASALCHDQSGWESQKLGIFMRSRKEKPVITNVFVNDVNISEGSKVSSKLFSLSNIKVRIERPKIVSWNPISYRYITKRIDTTFLQDSTFTLQHTTDDREITIIATDAFKVADTFKFTFIFPKFDIDSTTNEEYFKLKKKTANLSYILGKDSIQSFDMPFTNAGNDTLTIDSLFFHKENGKWFSVGVPIIGGYEYYDTLTHEKNINPVKIAPDSTEIFKLLFSPKALTGDGVLTDSLFIITNDITINNEFVPIQLEYNDIPTLENVEYRYYGKVFNPQKRDYAIPPHSVIRLTFSEPMDTVFEGRMSWGKSLFESKISPDIKIIALNHKWISSTILEFTPEYTYGSQFFDNIKPPAGIYIPTDSIELKLSTDFRDRAKTPKGPNYIDYNRDYITNNEKDSIIQFMVDSINFTVDSVTPSNKSINVKENRAIVMTFSSPVLRGSVDTSKYFNKTLILKTKYNNILKSTPQISYDTIYTEGNTVTFVPSKKFFYNDSVSCFFNGLGARDSLGFPVDLNKDGIPSHFFDPTSQKDNLQWTFKIRTVENDSVYPNDKSENLPQNTPIKLFFKAPVSTGFIDTSLVNNQTLTLKSAYSAGKQIRYDSIHLGTNSVTFFPEFDFFYGDSVYCHYKGLYTNDTSQFWVKLKQDSALFSSDDRMWSFKIKDIALESVSPKDSFKNVSVKTPFLLNFSDPISVDVFDTTLNHEINKSFYYTTRYSGGQRLPIRRITFLNDNKTVEIIPNHVFFSSDSVYVHFNGLKKNHRYYPTVKPPQYPELGDSVVIPYSWFFTTREEGFYTYPNPYKPNNIGKHRINGGIWFKNLHTLFKDRENPRYIFITIYDMNTQKVFKSTPIFIESGNPHNRPHWLWNCRNRANNDVASGIYFYVITDKDDNVILKSKLMIVR